MKELSDYSGEYNPDIEYADFSKDVLVKLLKEYARLYLLHDGAWNTIVSRELGADRVCDLGNEAWEMTYNHSSLRKFTEALDIKGNDVLTYMKIIQMTPEGLATGGLWEYTVDIKNNNHVMMTISRCVSLEYFERHGLEEQITGVCGAGGMEEVAMEKYAHFVNPDIQIIPLKLPPRKGPDDICCRWEFKLEQ
ncbi:DUF6125 family protein [Chloroflexota bacterium]